MTVVKNGKDKNLLYSKHFVLHAEAGHRRSANQAHGGQLFYQSGLDEAQWGNCDCSVHLVSLKIFFWLLENCEWRCILPNAICKKQNVWYKESKAHIWLQFLNYFQKMLALLLSAHFYTFFNTVDKLTNIFCLSNVFNNPFVLYRSFYIIIFHNVVLLSKYFLRLLLITIHIFQSLVHRYWWILWGKKIFSKFYNFPKIFYL